MKHEVVKEVVEKLIGSVKPIGESNFDEKAFENLKELCELTDSLVSLIYDVAYNNKHRVEHSRNIAGNYAGEFLSKRLNIKE